MCSSSSSLLANRGRGLVSSPVSLQTNLLNAMLITAHYYIQCLICQFDKQVPWCFVGTYCIAIHTPTTMCRRCMLSVTRHWLTMWTVFETYANFKELV